MSEAEMLACLQAAVAKWVPRLHIEQWEITCEVVPADKWADESAGARWDGNYYHFTGRLQVPANVEGLELEYNVAPDLSLPDRLERVALHEMVHILGHPADQMADQEIETWLGERTGDGRGHVTRESWHVIHVAKEQRINKTVRLLIEADRSGGWRG